MERRNDSASARPSQALRILAGRLPGWAARNLGQSGLAFICHLMYVTSRRAVVLSCIVCHPWYVPRGWSRSGHWVG